MLYERVASEVLPGWEISLAFVTPTVAKRLNRKLRSKSYTPNVLSYALGPRHGEVIICKEVASKEAARYGHSASEHVLFLFIHGLLHLKGMAHGTTMERREQELLAKYRGASTRAPYGSPHRNRNRHRDLPSQDRRRRRNPR